MTEPHEPAPGAIDVHQHLWPDELVDRLRARSTAAVPARLDAAHRRRAAVRRRPDGTTTSRPRIAADHEAGVGLGLPQPLRAARHRVRCAAPEAGPLLDAWHRGRRATLPDHFRGLGVGARRSTPTWPRSPACWRRPLRRRAAAGHRPAHARRAGSARRTVLLRRRAGRQAGASCTPGRSRGAPLDGGCRRGGRPSSATPRSCRPPGGAGTPFGGRAAVPAAAGASSPPAPGWRRCTTSGTSPRGGEASDGRPATCSSTPRRTARRRSTPWSGCSASTRSCSAATGPTPSRCASCSATPPPTRSGSTNPRAAARRHAAAEVRARTVAADRWPRMAALGGAGVRRARARWRRRP